MALLFQIQHLRRAVPEQYRCLNQTMNIVAQLQVLNPTFYTRDFGWQRSLDCSGF